VTFSSAIKERPQIKCNRSR